MKTEEIEFLLEIARLAARRSKAVRKQVGGVVSDSSGNIIATAYNGSVRGYHTNTLEYKEYDAGPFTHVDETCRPYRLVTDEDITIHAEQNLMAHAARRGISIMGGTVCLTLSPCCKCTSLLIQCGITEIIFMEKYRLHEDVQEKYGKYIKLTHWKH